MGTNVIVGIIGVVIFVGGLIFLLNFPQEAIDRAVKEDSLSQNNTMQGVPAEDNMKQDVNDEMMTEMLGMNYEYSGDLVDVTEGEVRGVNTEELATGIAMANFADGSYMMIATFENLPDPVGDDFYEGWIVRKEPFKFISTGKVEKVDGVYTNAYSSGEDLTGFSFYVLTLEPNDNDPAPADHIVEGDMEKN